MNYCLQNALCWVWRFREAVEKALYQIVPHATVLLSKLVYFSHSGLSWGLWSWVSISTSSSFSISWTSAQDWARTASCQGTTLWGWLPFHVSFIAQGPKSTMLNQFAAVYSQIPVNGSCLMLLSHSVLGISLSFHRRESSSIGASLRKLQNSILGAVLFHDLQHQGCCATNSCWNCAKWGLICLRAKCGKDRVKQLLRICCPSEALLGKD